MKVEVVDTTTGDGPALKAMWTEAEPWLPHVEVVERGAFLIVRDREEGAAT